MGAFLLVACSVYTEDLLEGPVPGTGGGGATASVSSAGGMVDPCANGIRDSGEADVDCGGSCAPCGLGDLCGAGADCGSGQCVDGVCCGAPCDGICVSCNQPGAVGTCTPIAEGQDPASECPDADTCNGEGACQSCTNNQNDPGETDVDCGGSACAPCGPSQSCVAPSDCDSGVCTSLVCQGPTCNDGVQNGDETDTDCGGSCPSACDPTEGCVEGTDCTSLICTGGMCAAPVCGDGEVNDTPETCDDGNTASFDGCSASCGTEVMHLLISEVSTTPSEGEFVEIYNPTSAAVDLEQVYLADFSTYYEVTQGPVSTGGSDFVAHFPTGATIPAGGFVTVAIKNATQFNSQYGVAPDFDMDDADAGAPAMVGDIGGSRGLTDGGEILVLFHWDGVSDLVTDLDYYLWGGVGMNKTGITVGGSTYAADTLPADQLEGPKDGAAGTVHRCDTAEATETKSGGNGTTGHDETSEDLSVAWKADATASPGGPPSAGLCP